MSPYTYQPQPSPVLGIDLSRLSIIFVVLVIAHLTWTRYSGGLAKIPGPYIASITSLWKFYWIWKEEFPWLNDELHQQYGPLVRIGPRHVSTSSPEALQKVHIQAKGFQKVCQGISHIAQSSKRYELVCHV